jgi:hypothetical protein
MKILRGRRQKKGNKIYESRVCVSIFLTSLDPPHKFDNLVNTQFSTSPDKSLHGHQVSSIVECVHYFILNKTILLYMEIYHHYFYPHICTHKHTHTHTHTYVHICMCVCVCIYIYIYIFIYLSYIWKSIQRYELSNIISLHTIHL